MAVANSQTRYGAVAMTFHWVIAALVLTNIYLGLSFDNYPKGDPGLFAALQLHKSIGLTVLVLSVLRLVWRLANPVPPLPRGMNPLLRLAARATHALLYFLIVFVPFTGWAMVSSSKLGLPTNYFGLFQWPSMPVIGSLTPDQRGPIHESFQTGHAILAWSAIVLIVLHVGGALYHQFLRRDDVMKRMLPGTNVTDLA